MTTETAVATTSGRPGPSGEDTDGGIVIDRRDDNAVSCRWTLPGFSQLSKQRNSTGWLAVGAGQDCRLLIYPGGDSQALPGFISVYLQVTGSSSKWECFASYRLSIEHQQDKAKSIIRDSWHRFSGKKKSHGWCDFAPAATVTDPRQGFSVNDSIVVTADILVLDEEVTFIRDGDTNSSGSTAATAGEVLSGKFTWKVRNFSLFKDMIRTQKLMSPAFSAGECSLRLSVYQSSVASVDYLSLCLESKETDKSGPSERSCWCLFRLSLQGESPTSKPMHRDSYGRFAADSKTGDNTSLGWNDFVTMAAFMDTETGYMQDDTATFTAAFHVIKETCTFSRSIERIGAKTRIVKSKNVSTGENFQGKFVWKIEHFTRLKDILKKRKITGLCVKSKRFTVGGRDCRLIVYPRGQSNPPNHLSMFLEVTDSKAGSSEWSCFVSHRLSVVNQKFEGDRAVSKESQNRYSKSAKDWGWREFLQLHTLFDQEAGFLVSDSVVFAAEVLVLKEVSEVKQVPAGSMPEGINAAGQPLHLLEPDTTSSGNKIRLHWRIENFVSFKDIMETRKIFSKFFEAGACELRIGVYESFDTLCIYLESDALASPERNFWVKYRIAVVNQRHPDRTEWKDSAICTKTWNNSVLQFMKVSEIMDPEAGHVHRDGVVLACEVLECCPWFEFADLDVYGNTTEEEADDLSTDPDELLELENGNPIPSEADEELFHSLLAKAGMHLANAEGDESLVHLDADALQAALRDKLLQDHSVLAAFLTGLRMYLEDPTKIKQLLVLVTPISPPAMPQHSGAQPHAAHAMVKGSCLMDMLMTVQALQYPLLDLLLDVMLMCCQHLIMLKGQSWELNDTEEDDQLDEESVSDNGDEPDAEQSAPQPDHGKRLADEAVTASSSSSMQTPSAFRAVSPEAPVTPANSSEIFPQHSTSAPSPSCISTDACLASRALPTAQAAVAHEEEEPTSPTSSGSGSQNPVQSADHQSADGSLHSLDRQVDSDPGATAATAGSASGSVSESGDEPGPSPKAEVDEVLRMALAWLRRADPYGFPAAGGNFEHGAAGRPPAGHKIGYLLSAVPRQYQPDIIMLLPKLLEPADHATAANLLIAHLAEATRLGPAAEALIRLPVLATLGLLTVDPATAKKLLTAVLNVLDSVRVHELPSAAGLILKLASQSSGPARLAAVKAVRQKLRLTPQAMTPGVLDAFRLVVMQHTDVAQEIVEGIDRQCGNLTASSSPSQGEHAQLTLHVFDIELLLDLLRNPTYKAQQVFEKLVAGNMVTGVQVAAVLERRQLQHALATAMPQLRATTLGSTFSDPAALHRLWGLPHPHAVPSDQVAPHNLAPQHAHPSAAEQQPPTSSTAAAAAAPANFPSPALPIANMGAPGMIPTASCMRHTHKMFPGAAQLPVTAHQFLQPLLPQAQPMLYPGEVQPGPPAPADLAQLSSLMHSCPNAVALADDFEPVLVLAESLAKSKTRNQNVREFVSWLYSSMFRIYSDERSREKMMHSLVQRATTFDSPTAQSTQQATTADSKQQTNEAANPSTTSGSSKTKGSAAASGASAAATASTSGSVQATQGKSTLASGQQVHRGAAPGRPAEGDGVAPAHLLLQLVHQHHEAAPTALSLVLQQVQLQHAQIDSYRQQLKEQQGKLQKASKQAQEAAAKATAQQQALQQQMGELEAKLGQARSDSKAQVKGHNTGKKELEDRVKELEGEIDWERAERQDAQQAAQRERKQTETRIKEAEDAASRAKAARRDEIKKINRDKSQLTERLKDAESAQLRLEGELHSLRSAAASSAERHDSSNAQMGKQLQQAHDAVQAKQDEISQGKKYTEGLERKLRGNQQYVANLEAQLQHEIVKAAPLLNPNLDALPTAQLQQLVHAQEETLKRARSMLACRHSEERAAAVATAAAHAVTGPSSSPESLRTSTSSRRDNINSVASSLESVTSATSGSAPGSARPSPGIPEASSGLGARSTSQSPAPHGMSMFYGGNGAAHNHFGQSAGATTAFPALGNGTFSSNGLLGGSGLLSSGSRHSSSNGLHHLW